MKTVRCGSRACRIGSERRVVPHFSPWPAGFIGHNAAGAPRAWPPRRHSTRVMSLASARLGTCARHRHASALQGRRAGQGGCLKRSNSRAVQSCRSRQSGRPPLFWGVSSTVPRGRVTGCGQASDSPFLSFIPRKRSKTPPPTYSLSLSERANYQDKRISADITRDCSVMPFS
jgi:hypothetical protein